VLDIHYFYVSTAAPKKMIELYSGNFLASAYKKMTLAVYLFNFAGR